MLEFFKRIFSMLFNPYHDDAPAPSPGPVSPGALDADDPDYRGRALPRGIRNNNPGNIEYTGISWQGLASKSSDGRFCIFTSSKWGIRCLVYNLNNYQRKYGLKSVGQMIFRWAPESENNTTAYAIAVAKEMNVGINDVLKWNAKTKYQMAVAIMRHENGKNPLDYYTAKLIREAVSLAK